MVAQKIRILLVDDHKDILDSLTALLRLDPTLDVVGSATDGQMAVTLARRLHPDVVIMDIRMPSLSGIKATRLIVMENPAINVIGYSTYSNYAVKAEMQNAGASACINKRDPIQSLMTAIHECRS
jgi:DNA-binding NarL/FixJ family response regulator